MNLRDEARRLAEEAAQRMTDLNNRPSTSIIESALLAFAKLVLERHSFRCIAALDKTRVASVVGSSSQTVRQSIDTTTTELLRELTKEKST